MYVLPNQSKIHITKNTYYHLHECMSAAHLALPKLPFQRDQGVPLRLCVSRDHQVIAKDSQGVDLYSYLGLQAAEFELPVGSVKLL